MATDPNAALEAQEGVQSAANLFGGNYGTAEQQLTQYELEAQQGRELAKIGPTPWSNDQYGAFAGFWMPPHIDEDAFQQAVDAAHTWASNTDFRDFPPASQIVEMYTWATTNGVSLSDQHSVAQYLSQRMPADQASKMPWAASGMNKTQWDSTINQVQDSYQNWTGQLATGADLSTIQDELSKGQTTTQVMTQMLHNESFQKTYGWTKYGVTYDQFQQQKNDPNKQQQVVARLGQGAINSDAAYISQLGTPTQPGVRSGGGGQQSTSARTQANKASLSSIR